MKKIMILMLAIFIAIPAIQAKDKYFTGKITYQISFDMENLPEEARGMLPKTMSMLIGEHHVKTVLFTQVGKQSSIIDLKNKTKVALMDIMGQQYAIETSEEEMMKEIGEAKDFSVDITDESKEIAGYNCYKVKIKNSEGNMMGEAWFTKEIEVNPAINYGDQVFHNVEGLLMEFELDAGQGMMMQFTAVDVEKEKVKEKEFEVPEGYQKTTREELMRTFGG
ncbi:MAG: hypothetical protein ACLFPE_07780 [Bacteroidales bacterium]